MNLRETKLEAYSKMQTLELYTAIVIAEGEGKFRTDAGVYDFCGPSILFVSPFQTFQVLDGYATQARVLDFHGDFYCIEFHKQEVACNGVLFNNVYLSPTLFSQRAQPGPVRRENRNDSESAEQTQPTLLLENSL